MGSGEPVAQPEEFHQFEVDCGTGQAVEVVLDAEEAAPLAAMRVQALATRAEQQRREEALARIQERARVSRDLADLLLVLGLEA
jgi:hypothetical protein